jgi:UDP-3-O-[3-hydroxymyristoyl] glucosamine N-acyltransferase
VSGAGAGRRLSAREIAALTGGRLLGEADCEVGAVAPLERAGPGDLSFLAAPRYLQYFQRTRASIVLLRSAHAAAESAVAARIVVDDPQTALLAVVPLLYAPPAWAPGVDATARIGAGARWDEPIALGPHVVLGAGVRIGRNARVGAGTVLGDGVQLGHDVVLYPRVVCYPGVVIGDRVIVHAGAVLGSDGFGYVPGEAGGAHRKIPHVGRVVIGDDVEIGANTTVDRGSVDDTVIGPGTKIDNLVQIGHNVHLGARCLVTAQVGIGGSTHLEDDVIVGGQAGIQAHLTLGRGARIGGQSGVIRDVPPGGTVMGYPARDRVEYLRAQAALFRLSKIVDELEALVQGPR